MAKEYKCLSAMERDIAEKVRVAYDKGYKQGIADAKEDVPKIIEEAEKRGFAMAMKEHTEKQEYDYEKDYEGCDKCIFESFDLDDKCCRCKHNEPYFNESHFIPKPCQHEWEDAELFDSDGYHVTLGGRRDFQRCKKCGILRIEV